jgi:hypothetical protein
MEDHKKVFSIQILIEVEVEVVKPHFEDDTEACMVDIINMKVSLMEVNEETLEEEVVMEVVLEIIKVNNQITLLEILSFATSHYAISMQLIVVCNYLGHVCNYKFGIV